MRTQNTCSVISDLLPLYKEGMVRPETAEAVAAHLKDCKNCRAAYERMNDALPLTKTGTERETAKQTAPLRKFRFHFWMNILGLPLWLPLLLAGIIVCLALWITGFCLVLAAWCIPLTTACVSLAGLPALAYSCFYGFGGNALFFAGCILVGFALTVPLGWLCKKLTAGFFRGTSWLFKKTVLRKHDAKKASKPKGDVVS